MLSFWRGPVWVVMVSLTAACADSVDVDEGESGTSAATGGSDTTSSGGLGGQGAAGGAGTTSTGGGGAGGAAGGSGGQGTGGSMSSCDPLTAGCVTCPPGSCAAPDSCCGDTNALVCSTTCVDPVNVACDGAEDCSGGDDCCVDAEADTNGLQKLHAQCGASCPISSSVSTSSGSVQSIACRMPSDCAGVADSNEVPFSECCTIGGVAVGSCVDTTTAGYVMALGGSCL